MRNALAGEVLAKPHEFIDQRGVKASTRFGTRQRGVAEGPVLGEIAEIMINANPRAAEKVGAEIGRAGIGISDLRAVLLASLAALFLAAAFFDATFRAVLSLVF